MFAWRASARGRSDMVSLDDIDGPSDQELAAIELESPLIAAEITVVELEAAMLASGHAPTAEDWRTLRRARRRVLRAALDLFDLCDDALSDPIDPSDPAAPVLAVV